MIAADTLCTAGDVKVYNRSKIRVIKQTALVSTGTENDGFRFEKWFFEQNGEEFICEDSFAVLILTRDKACEAFTTGDTLKLSTIRESTAAMAIGVGSAVAAAEILMRVSKLNAHKAVAAAANYHTHCGPPIYSITKKHLEAIHADFSGYWIGTYQTPMNKLAEHLITQKEWMKS